MGVRRTDPVRTPATDSELRGLGGVGLRVDGEEHSPDLEEPDIGASPGDVVRGRRRQSRQQRRAQHRLFSAQGVRGRERRLGTEASRGFGRDQRNRDCFREADTHQRVGDETTLGLCAREAAHLLLGLRNCATDGVEADATRHFLDEVDLAFEVGAERGRHRFDVVGAATDVDAEWTQGVEHFNVGERCAKHAVHLRSAHVDARPRDRMRVLVDKLRRDARVGHLDEQLHRPGRRTRNRVGVDTALEARTRFRTQLQPLRRTGDPHALEVRSFQQNAGGAIRHLAVAAAHDSGDGLRRTIAVADQEVGRVELPFHAVEGGDLLPHAREANHDAGPGQAIEVERVQRLVPFEQHIVGDIDDVADRAHPGLDQALLHPRRRRPHRDLGGPGEIPRTPLGGVDRDRNRDGRTGARRRGVGNEERRAEVGGKLAGHAHDAHRVGTVGRNREIEDHVVEAEDPAHVGAKLRRPIERVEVEDAVVIVAEPELLRGAQHPVGDLATDLASLQREAAGQRRARRRERHHHPGMNVGCTAHDAGLAFAEVDIGELQPVGVGMREHFEDAGDTHTGDLRPRLLDGVDLQPELIQRGDRARRHRRRPA